MPEATLLAFGNRGDPARRRNKSAAWAERTLRPVEAAGTDLAAVTSELEREGVRSFCDSYRGLLKCIEAKLECIEPPTSGRRGRVMQP